MFYKIWSKFLKWFGDIMFATKPPKVRSFEIRHMLEIIKSGDIICRSYNYYLDSFLIPGKYTHSGIVIKNTCIVHSIAEGVEYIDPIDFIKDADKFIILRPKYRTNALMKVAIKKAESLIGKDYDFMFDMDKDAYYCTELTVACLNEADIWPQSQIIKRFWIKKEVYTVKSLIDACEKIYEFA